MQGKWSEGWNLYENRPQMRDMRQHPLVWRGEDLRGKTIMLATEQGLGDSVFAMRYLKVLKDMGARVLVQSEKTLMRLFQAMPEVDGVYDRQGQPNVPFDFCSLMMSLPGYLSPNDSGPGAPYIRLPKSPAVGGKRVGLCWNGSTVVGPPKERNMPLALLKPLADAHPDWSFVSLQKGNAAEEAIDCGFRVFDAMEHCHDVFDTAQVIASLDLVITTDTLIPHLSGALGVETILLDRFASCWQWESAKLYDSMTILRQKTRGKWEPVVEQLIEETA
jgi:hypothetical protein